MILKQAFNILTRIHSRAAFLKRKGSPDSYSPIRITPSNYFRFLEGPGSTTIHGREFIIPIDTMSGQVSQTIVFAGEPEEGSFFLNYNDTLTDELFFDTTAAIIQAALREIEGLEDVIVTGDFIVGFTVIFLLVASPLTLVFSSGVLPLDVDVPTITQAVTAMSPLIKRGDKIIDDTYGSLAIDEIIEMPDIGGTIMGYRVRSE